MVSWDWICFACCGMLADAHDGLVCTWLTGAKDSSDTFLHPPCRCEAMPIVFVIVAVAPGKPSFLTVVKIGKFVIRCHEIFCSRLGSFSRLGRAYPPFGIPLVATQLEENQIVGRPVKPFIVRIETFIYFVAGFQLCTMAKMVSREKVREAAERARFLLPLVDAWAVETMLAWQLKHSSGFRQFTKTDGTIRIWIRNDVAQPAHILSCDQKKTSGLTARSTNLSKNRR